MSEFLCLPNIVATIPSGDKKIIIQRDLNGYLFSSLFFTSGKINFDKIKNLENKRINLLRNLYEKTIREQKNKPLPRLKAEQILWERLKNSRFELFFGAKSKFNYLKNKNVYINGILQPNTINDILQRIKNNPLFQDKKSNYYTVTGHGDGHRGNIMISKDKLYYIDTEYSEKEIPLESEFSKPYYNDLFGFLFFSDEKLLYSIFGQIEIKFNNNSIYIDNVRIRNKKTLNFLKLMTNKKIALINELAEDKTKFNNELFRDLLIICHILTQNPNQYKNNTFAIFIIILFYLDQFKVLEDGKIFLNTEYVKIYG